MKNTRSTTLSFRLRYEDQAVLLAWLIYHGERPSNLSLAMKAILVRTAEKLRKEGVDYAGGAKEFVESYNSESATLVPNLEPPELPDIEITE